MIFCKETPQNGSMGDLFKSELSEEVNITHWRIVSLLQTICIYRYFTANLKCPYSTGLIRNHKLWYLQAFKNYLSLFFFSKATVSYYN